MTNAISKYEQAALEAITDSLSLGQFLRAVSERAICNKCGATNTRNVAGCSHASCGGLFILEQASKDELQKYSTAYTQLRAK